MCVFFFFFFFGGGGGTSMFQTVYSSICPAEHGFNLFMKTLNM